MIKNKKTTNVLIFSITLIIIIVAFIGLRTNPKKDSKYYAEQFIEVLTTPEDAEFTKYYHDVFDSGTVKQSNLKDYADSIKKEYGDLMTNEAFDNAIFNRFIPWDVLIKEDSNYSIKIDSIDVKEAKIYEGGRVHYIYLLSLRVLFSNGEGEVASVSGDIVMIEENGRWIVDAFRQNSDYQDLHKLLLTNPKI